MNLPRLHGIVPPVATPLTADERLDRQAFTQFVEHLIGAGVHGLWILGTTARFDLLPDAMWREIAELAIETNRGRLPTVLNVSDMGTKRVLARAKTFDDLPYDYLAVLPPWYQVMTEAEVTDFFLELADSLAKPLVIYNAPWICNQLSFNKLRKLAEHPRIVGCKDVTPALNRTLDWPVAERRALDFSYLHGNDQIALSTRLGADGFVTSLSNPLPELVVATWNAARAGDHDAAFQLQVKMNRLSQALGAGTMHAALESLCRYRGFFSRMLPSPLRSLDSAAEARVREIADSVGVLP